MLSIIYFLYYTFLKLNIRKPTHTHTHTHTHTYTHTHTHTHTHTQPHTHMHMHTHSHKLHTLSYVSAYTDNDACSHTCTLACMHL